MIPSDKERIEKYFLVAWSKSDARDQMHTAMFVARTYMEYFDRYWNCTPGHLLKLMEEE